MREKFNGFTGVVLNLNPSMEEDHARESVDKVYSSVVSGALEPKALYHNKGDLFWFHHIHESNDANDEESTIKKTFSIAFCMFTREYIASGWEFAMEAKWPHR